MIRGEVRGSSSPSVGMICTTRMSEAREAVTSGMIGGLAAVAAVPIGAASPSIVTACCKSGRQARGEHDVAGDTWWLAEISQPA